jgi:hypothetical protein
MTVPGVPVFDPEDAALYGWRMGLDSGGNAWLHVIDGRGAICLRPGTHITYLGSRRMRGTAQLFDLQCVHDAHDNAWLVAGADPGTDSVTLTRDRHAVIFAPGGFLRFGDGRLVAQAIELAGVMKQGPPEST